MLKWNEPKIINPVLPDNTVVLFLAKLENFFPHLVYLRSLLSDKEIKKADRFHFEIHQKRYAVSQSLLRFLLSHYLTIAPKEISLSTTAYGKPFVENAAIHFNISHSHEFAIYAFSSATEVGVDLEYWRERKFFDGIIDSNFSKTEQQIYHSLPEELKMASFYQGWTCNEAYIKAIGMGLSFPLQDFSVEMDPNKAARLLEAKPRSDVKTHWHLQMLPCPKNYSAALAMDNQHYSLQLYSFTNSHLPKL